MRTARCANALLLDYPPILMPCTVLVSICLVFRNANTVLIECHEISLARSDSTVAIQDASVLPDVNRVYWALVSLAKQLLPCVANQEF